jgi:hypothetical protein
MFNRILGPQGTALVELGGVRAWRTYAKGDLTISLQWLDLGEQGQCEGPEAVMALFPANRRVNGAAYIVPQANAWAYVGRDGNPTSHLFAAAFKAAVQLGFHPDKSTVFRIMDAICEGMGDLVKMPSEQPGDLHVAKAVAGIEATMSLNGKVVAEAVF